MARVFKLCFLLALFVLPVSLWAYPQDIVCNEAELANCYRRAEQFYRGGDFETAKELFEKIIKIDVDYKKASSYLVKCHDRLAEQLIQEKTEAQRLTFKNEKPLKVKSQKRELGASAPRQWEEDWGEAEENYQQRIESEAKKRQQETELIFREEQKRLELEAKRQKQALAEQLRKKQQEIAQETQRRREALLKLEDQEKRQRGLEAERRRERLASLEREEQQQMEIEARRRQEVLAPLLAEERKQRALEERRRQEVLRRLEQEEQKQRVVEAKKRREVLYSSFDLEEVQAVSALPIKPPEPYRVSPGDVLHISVSKIPEFEKDVAVKPGGSFTFLFVGDFPAAGLTLNELGQKLEERLKTHIRKPEVVVTRAQSVTLKPEDIPHLSSATPPTP